MSEASVPDCVCPLAGYCRQFQRYMTPRLHKRCKTRSDFRWHFAWKIGEMPKRKPKEPPPEPCIHKGADTRQVECIKCGPNRGKLVQLFVCDLQGLEVSVERWTSAQMRDEVCRSCRKYSAPASESGQ